MVDQPHGSTQTQLLNNAIPDWLNQGETSNITTSISPDGSEVWCSVRFPYTSEGLRRFERSNTSLVNELRNGLGTRRSSANRPNPQSTAAPAVPAQPKRRMTQAARRKISQAQKKRFAQQQADAQGASA